MLKWYLLKMPFKHCYSMSHDWYLSWSRWMQQAMLAWPLCFLRRARCCCLSLGGDRRPIIAGSRLFCLIGRLVIFRKDYERSIFTICRRCYRFLVGFITLSGRVRFVDHFRLPLCLNGICGFESMCTYCYVSCSCSRANFTAQSLSQKLGKESWTLASFGKAACFN